MSLLPDSDGWTVIKKTEPAGYQVTISNLAAPAASGGTSGMTGYVFYSTSDGNSAEIWRELSEPVKVFCADCIAVTEVVVAPPICGKCGLIVSIDSYRIANEDTKPR